MSSSFYGGPTREEVERLRSEVARAREQISINAETIRNLSLLASRSNAPPPPPLPPTFPSAPPNFQARPPPAPVRFFPSYSPGLPSHRHPYPVPGTAASQVQAKPPKGLLSTVKLLPSSLDPFMIDLRAPETFGEFSCRYGSTLLASNQAKRYLKKPLPALPIDVNEGVEKYLFAREKNERFQVLLKWISENAEIEETLHETVNQSDFVCLRGTLLRFASFEARTRPFSIAATKVNDVIFLFEHSWYHTAAKKSATYHTLKSIEAISEHEDCLGLDYELDDEYFAVLTADFVPEQIPKKSPSLRVLYAAKVDLFDHDTGERCALKTYYNKQHSELQGALMAPSAVFRCTVKGDHLTECRKERTESDTTTVKHSARWIYRILSEIKKQMEDEPNESLVMIEKTSDTITISRSSDQTRWFLDKAFQQRFSQ